jgi:glycosyltransferase involved in cell wall biosynthesis
MAEKTLSIIIPCYNEAKSLPLVLPELIQFVNELNYRLIITNDGSKDDSLKILQQYFADEPRCRVVNHKVNKGYGGAIKSGIQAAETDYVITIDADGQHYLEDVDKLFALIQQQDADMIVGSRKGQQEASAFRGLGKTIIRGIAKFLMPMDIYDINSGMKIYNTALAKKYLPLCPDAMAYSDIIALVFINQRHRVTEEPIRIKPRAAGESTISVGTAYDTIMEIVNVVILFNPMRIFLAISILFVIAALVWNWHILIRGGGVSTGGGMLVVCGFIFFMLGLVTEQLSQIRKMQIRQ